MPLLTRLRGWLFWSCRMSERCHFCGVYAVSQFSSIGTYQYKQQAYEVLIDYSVCGSCREEVITTEQIHINEARILEAKKKIDSIKLKNEIRSAKGESLRRSYEKAEEAKKEGRLQPIALTEDQKKLLKPLSH